MLDNLKIKDSSNNFTLTNNFAESINKSRSTSIPVDHISSIKSEYSDEFILLILAAVDICLCFYFSLSWNNNSILYIGIITSAVLCLFYYFTREKAIIISSNSAKISINLNNRSHQETMKLMSEIESRITSKPYSQSRQSREAKWGSGR